ncbi:MarR family winged helix-turn-helix transcriptional regulator [Albidovulum sp.]
MAEFLLERFLPYQLAVLAARVSREFSSVYAERFGLGIAEWRVLAHLHDAGPVSVREIHRRVDMDKSKVSRAASRLETAGLISKEPNAEDRRLLRLALTGKGQAVMAELAPLALDFEARLLSRLGADAPAFRALLERLLAGTP